MCNKICNNRRANLFSLICDNKYFMEYVWNVPPWVIHSLFYFIHKNTLHKHNTYIHSSSSIYYLFFWSSSYTSTISDQTKTNTHLHHSFLMNTNSNLEKSDKNQNSSKQSCCTKYTERERKCTNIKYTMAKNTMYEWRKNPYSTRIMNGFTWSDVDDDDRKDRKRLTKDILTHHPSYSIKEALQK